MENGINAADFFPKTIVEEVIERAMRKSIS